MKNFLKSSDVIRVLICALFGYTLGQIHDNISITNLIFLIISFGGICLLEIFRD